jgi:uncharacterized protein YbjT (DUF2867 family)
MKVFVAGGSGAMGRRLVPQLIAAGYQVAAMTRDARTTSPTTSPRQSASGYPTSRK